MLNYHVAMVIAAALYFTPVFHTGGVISDVFSRTIAISVPGYKAKVHRVGGSATYHVDKADGTSVTLTCRYLYDGSASGVSTVTVALDNKPRRFQGQLDTDASGLMLNPLFWSSPSSFVAGTKWTVRIGVPWELGPAGTQVNRIVWTDPVTHTAMIERDGRGDGMPDDGGPPRKVVLENSKTTYTVLQRATEWHGYTIVRDGIIVSDELVAMSAVTLRPAHGPDLHGTKREYILLNEAPGATNPEEKQR